MADPRFYRNRGPFTLARVSVLADAALPSGANPESEIADLASLENAGACHLAFCVGKNALRLLASSRAGFCLVPPDVSAGAVPDGTVPIVCKSVQYAFAAVARLFYPEWDGRAWSGRELRDPSAKIGEGAVLAPGVVVGANAEIGERTRIGPNAVIGPGVAVGRDCDIGSGVFIGNSYIGDRVTVLPGACIGQSGFGFASDAGGHTKIPQIGRVIVQDNVEIGASTTIDRGALGDTVIGEGTKIDNLVQIGHNTRIGRHCIIVAQSGISGSCELGDFVVLGGQAGVADHALIGDGARLAARCAAAPGPLPGGRDYGGVPARPMKQWARELAAVSLLAKRRRQE